MSLVTICPQSYYNIIDHIPMLYITSSWFVYLITGDLYLFIHFTYFSPHPRSALPSVNHWFLLCICESVFILFCLFCFLDSTYE